PGNFGQAAILSVSGSDIAGHHGIVASTTTEFEKPELQGSLTYTYGRLPVDLQLSLYRAIAPRQGLSLGAYKPTWVQETVGASSGLLYAIPRAFDTQSFALSYNFGRYAGEFPVPADKLDPYETPSFPTRGVVGFLHLGYGYSNAESFLWSVGP